MKVLENKNGGYYTQTKESSIRNMVLTDKVYLAANDSPENWKEISKEEGENLKKMQSVANDINNVDDVDKAIMTADVLPLVINEVEMSDNESLARKRAYPLWSKCVGQNLRKGYKVQHEDKLFRVVQAHTVQAHFPPSEATASLYEEINETHKGTKDDPIPYSGNMTIEAGKYYTQNGKLYECVIGSGNPVFEDMTKLEGYGFVKEVKL